jgi:hypothetical protein
MKWFFHRVGVIHMIHLRVQFATATNNLTPLFIQILNADVSDHFKSH